MDVKRYENRGVSKKKELQKFLKRIRQKTPKGLLQVNARVAKATWKEADCLSCANCCLKMTPTFKKSEVKRLAANQGMSYDEYFDKYLKIDKAGDIINRSTPCQHLDLKTNRCQVYEIRPSDCRLFPHFERKDFNDISDIIGSNIPRCPATLIFVEKLRDELGAI